MTAPARPIETDPEDAGVVAFAVHLLRLIAEDPLVRGTHRAAARRHLARLRAGPGRVLTADDFRD